MSKRNRQSEVSAIINAESAAAVTPQIESGATEKPKSIRQLIMSGITAGRSTKEIAAEVQLHFPNSAAAAKSVKHIAWYRSRMKKDAATAAAGAKLLGEVSDSAE